MMNRTMYRQVLEDQLDFFMNQHRTTHFFQDGALCHRFAGKPNIELIKWPGNSPDPNPIENVCAWKKVQLKSTSPSNIEQLKEEILKLRVIKMKDSAYLKNLVESMPWRLQEVIERGGNIIHY
jgi:transposase